MEHLIHHTSIHRTSIQTKPKFNNENCPNIANTNDRDCEMRPPKPVKRTGHSASAAAVPKVAAATLNVPNKSSQREKEVIQSSKQEAPDLLQQQQLLFANSHSLSPLITSQRSLLHSFSDQPLQQQISTQQQQHQQQVHSRLQSNSLEQHQQQQQRGKSNGSSSLFICRPTRPSILRASSARRPKSTPSHTRSLSSNSVPTCSRSNLIVSSSSHSSSSSFPSFSPMFGTTAVCTLSASPSSSFSSPSSSPSLSSSSMPPETFSSSSSSSSVSSSSSSDSTFSSVSLPSSSSSRSIYRSSSPSVLSNAPSILQRKKNLSCLLRRSSSTSQIASGNFFIPIKNVVSITPLHGSSSFSDQRVTRPLSLSIITSNSVVKTTKSSSLSSFSVHFTPTCSLSSSKPSASSSSSLRLFDFSSSSSSSPPPPPPTLLSSSCSLLNETPRYLSSSSLFLFKPDHSHQQQMPASSIDASSKAPSKRTATASIESSAPSIVNSSSAMNNSSNTIHGKNDNIKLTALDILRSHRNATPIPASSLSLPPAISPPLPRSATPPSFSSSCALLPSSSCHPSLPSSSASLGLGSTWPSNCHRRIVFQQPRPSSSSCCSPFLSVSPSLMSSASFSPVSTSVSPVLFAFSSLSLQDSSCKPIFSYYPKSSATMRFYQQYHSRRQQAQSLEAACCLASLEQSCCQQKSNSINNNNSHTSASQSHACLPRSLSNTCIADSPTILTSKLAPQQDAPLLRQHSC